MYYVLIIQLCTYRKRKKKVRKKNYLTKRRLQKHKSIPKYPWETGGQTTPSLPRNV